MNPEKDSLLTTEEVAKILHCKPTYVHKLCRKRKISYIPVGKRYLFRPEKIAKYLERLEIPPKRERPF